MPRVAEYCQSLMPGKTADGDEICEDNTFPGFGGELSRQLNNIREEMLVDYARRNIKYVSHGTTKDGV